VVKDVIRLIIFLLGFGALLLGAESHFQFLDLPFDCRSVICKLGLAVVSLDVLLLVVGVFLILIAWVFTRLAQQN
jgi:hypothetical protein